MPSPAQQLREQVHRNMEESLSPLHWDPRFKTCSRINWACGLAIFVSDGMPTKLLGLSTMV